MEHERLEVSKRDTKASDAGSSVSFSPTRTRRIATETETGIERLAPRNPCERVIY